MWVFLTFLEDIYLRILHVLFPLPGIPPHITELTHRPHASVQMLTPQKIMASACSIKQDPFILCLLSPLFSFKGPKNIYV
jgi:hypothetical protein